MVVAAVAVVVVAVVEAMDRRASDGRYGGGRLHLL